MTYNFTGWATVWHNDSLAKLIITIIVLSELVETTAIFQTGWYIDRLTKWLIAIIILFEMTMHLEWLTYYVKDW